MKFENAILSLALAALAVLPILESLLRKTLHVGLSGSTALVQHLTLIVGMLGAILGFGSVGFVPCSPLEANHFAYSGPVNGSTGSTGSSCRGNRKRSSVPAPQM